MSQEQRTPSQGLKILEALYQKHSSHQGIINSLISAYIHFGIHDKAMGMIADIPDNITNIQSLKFKAWVEHKNGNLDKEREIWDSILNISYIPQVHSKINTLILRSNREINLKSSDIPLLSVIRNEMLRLPFFIEYYRDLGITQFIFVDNNSDDGSFEFLLQQPDCHVFWTNDSYTQAGSGIQWVHYLLDTYISKNQWCIHADADEFLVYPFCEQIKLNTLISYLEVNSQELMPSFMLDLFPESLEKSNLIILGDNLINKSPYFMNNYKFYYQIQPPYIRPFGGLFPFLSIKTSVLTKSSLFKNSNRFKFLSATHYTTPTITSTMTSAYLHFKMAGDFYKKSLQIVYEKEHSGGGRTYKDYIRLYEKNRDIQITTFSNIVKYQNSQQLIDLGLIQCPNDWKEFIKDEVNHG